MTFIISKVEKGVHFSIFLTLDLEGLKFFNCFHFLLISDKRCCSSSQDAQNWSFLKNLLPMGLWGKELTLGPMWLIPQTERQVERVFKWRPPSEVKTRTCSKVKGLAVHLRTSCRCLKVFTIGGTRNQRTRRIKKVGESNSSKLTIEARAPHMH